MFNNSNLLYGGHGSHKTSSTTYDYPEFPELNKQKTPTIDLYLNYEDLMVDISSGINIYNWFVSNYNGVIDKYNDFINYCQNNPLFINIELKKIGENSKYDILNYSFKKNVIPHQEVINLLNEMNRQIKIMKTFISDIKNKITNQIVEYPYSIVPQIYYQTQNELIGGVIKKYEEWKNIKDNINSKLTTGIKNIDSIENKINMIDNLFDNYNNIKEIIDIIKNNKLQKTIKNIIDTKKYHQNLDNNNNKEHKKYTTKNYDLNYYLDLPNINESIINFQQNNKQDENKNNIDNINSENLLIKNLDEKIYTINETIDYIKKQNILLDKKIKDLENKFEIKDANFTENDFSFLNENTNEDISNYSKYKESLNNINNNLTNNKNLQEMIKNGKDIINNIKNEINAEIVKLNPIDEKDYNNNKEIKQLLKNIDKELKKFDEVGILIALKENAKKHKIDINLNFPSIIENNDVENFHKLKEFANLIKKKKSKDKFSFSDRNINDIDNIIKNINVEYEKIMKIIENVENKEQAKHNEIENKKNTYKILNSDIDFNNYCQVSNINNIIKNQAFNSWFEKYKQLYATFVNNNTGDLCEFLNSQNKELNALKDKIDKNEMLRFSKLSPQNITKINSYYTEISKDIENLNLKLFDTIDELKKIATLTDLNLSFITENTNDKNIPIKDRKFFLPMKGGNKIYNKSKMLNVLLNSLFKLIENYMHKYVKALRMNRIIIYETFYKYIIYNELINNTYNPKLYITYDELKENITFIKKYNNTYLSNVKNKLLVFCDNLINLFDNKKKSILYIDINKKSFEYLLLTLHMSKLTMAM
jgi:hypothetical protein